MAARPVLQGVDLTIAPGEIVAVIGRNGVGKSTLMRTLTGLLPVRRGDPLAGRDVTATAPSGARATASAISRRAARSFPS